MEATSRLIYVSPKVTNIDTTHTRHLVCSMSNSVNLHIHVSPLEREPLE